MSERIGEVYSPSRWDGNPSARVEADEEWIYVTGDPTYTLNPTQARNYAALLMRAANECEILRMQAKK